MKTPRQDPDSVRVAALATDLRVLVSLLKRRLRDEAHAGDLTLSQMAVIGRLEREGPATVTTLAHAEGMRPQSMGATISTLQAAGLVSGAPDPNDGRQIILSITPACESLLEVRRAEREDWLCRAMQTKLSAQEQEQLAISVALLRRLAEP